MERLEDLLRRFGDTPERIVVKADVLRRGVRRTPDLEAAGASACDIGLTGKVMARFGQGQPVPSQFHFVDDETTVDIRLREDAPYAIHTCGDGYRLYHGRDELGAVRFTQRPAYMERFTSDGTPVADHLMQRGPSCLLVDALNFCAYVPRGDTCRYCLLGPAQQMMLRMGHARPIPDYARTAEAVAIAAEEMDLQELKLSGGGLYDTRREARFHSECLEAILRRVPAPPEITIFSQALDVEDQRRLRELGATNVCFDLEVWEERLWPAVVPGKLKAVGRDTWLRRLEDAVDVFGRGHVGTNFVAGFESAPRPGFLSRDEALRSYAGAFATLVERGIVPWFTIWNAHPAISGFGEDDPPGTDFYLQLGPMIHESLEKHGVYPDLGFRALGSDPETLGLYCFYCYSMQFTRDYPRLIGRRASAGTRDARR